MMGGTVAPVTEPLLTRASLLDRGATNSSSRDAGWTGHRRFR